MATLLPLASSVDKDSNPIATLAAPVVKASPADEPMAML